MSLSTLLTRYKLAAQAAGKSPASIKHIEVSLRYFNDFMGGIDDVTKVTKSDLERFIVALQQRQTWQENSHNKTRRNLSLHTIQTYAKGVKVFWSWLFKEAIIKVNTLAHVPLPRSERKLPKVLSEDEVKQLLRYLQKRCERALKKDNRGSTAHRDLAMTMVLLDSGIRLSELVNIKVSDVDSRQGTIKVYGKGRRERVVPISQPTMHALVGYEFFTSLPANREYLFVSKSGQKLDTGWVQKLFAKLGKQAGLKQRLSPHKLRHTCGTLSLKAGANLEFVKRLLGHSNLRVTEQYLHLCDSDLLQAHRSFSPVTKVMSAK